MDFQHFNSYSANEIYTYDKLTGIKQRHLTLFGTLSSCWCNWNWMKRKITCSWNRSGLNNDIRIVLQTFYGDFHWHSLLIFCECGVLFLSLPRCESNGWLVGWLVDWSLYHFIKWCDPIYLLKALFMYLSRFGY